jgi:hypothetical protein
MEWEVEQLEDCIKSTWILTSRFIAEYQLIHSDSTHKVHQAEEAMAPGLLLETKIAQRRPNLSYRNKKPSL